MSELPTVGVEEEFLLVDPRTGEPAPRNAAVAAEDSGVRLLALGLPPATPHKFPVTDTERYQRIATEFGMLAHEQGICGCHVHVRVPDRAAALHVGNWLRPWLPSLLALSANSALYRNTDTGYASWRSVLWRRWPVAGAPPFFGSPDEYDRAVRMLVDTGVILDQGMIYWDVRPSADFPTVEVRVADVPATVAETVLLATLVRAAVMTALDDRGDSVRRLPPGALRAAYWKAAHDGRAGHTLDLIHDRGAVPARDQLGALVRRLRPALDALGEYDRVVDELDRIVTQGNGAMRQRQAWQKAGDVMDVIAEAATATLS